MVRGGLSCVRTAESRGPGPSARGLPLRKSPVPKVFEGFRLQNPLQEPVLSNAYICAFKDLQIQSVLIDEALVIAFRFNISARLLVLVYSLYCLTMAPVTLLPRRCTCQVLRRVKSAKRQFALVEVIQNPENPRKEADATTP